MSPFSTPHRHYLDIRLTPSSAMGKSRSVTVTLAYLLSTRPSLNLQSALELVRSSRPIAEPNDGFMAQLTLYASMGCPSDIDAQPAYQRWLYQKDVELSVATGRAPDKLRFEDEEDQGSDPLKGEVEKELKCKKCRKTLATGQYLIPHVPRAEKNSNGNPNDPNDTTDYSPISSLPPTHPLYNATTTTSSTLPTPNPAASSLLPASCRHHFIHPLSWMRATLEREELEGRLECPNTKCGALVGRYAWQGMRCSCGVWVVPGFSLQGARVDEVLKRNAPIIAGGSVAGVRLPPGMRAGGGQNL
jgi:dual specificity phosphatase 12